MNLEKRLFRIEDNDEMKHNVRSQVAKIINTSAWENKLDISQKVMMKTIQQLRKNKNIHVCQADKGNVTVVMNYDEYDSKLLSMLNAFPYKKLTQDPHSNMKKPLKTLSNK